VEGAWETRLDNAGEGGARRLGVRDAAAAAMALEVEVEGSVSDDVGNVVLIGVMRSFANVGGEGVGLGGSVRFGTGVVGVSSERVGDEGVGRTLFENVDTGRTGVVGGRSTSTACCDCVDEGGGTGSAAVGVLRS